MTRSIVDSCSIDRKEFAINQNVKEINHEVSRWLDRFSIPIPSIIRNIQSIEENSQLVKICETDFFSDFLGTIFDVSLKQNIVPWSYQNKIEIKTELHWCYSLKVQYSMVKVKLKQHQY